MSDLGYIFELNGLIKNARLNKAVLEGVNKRDANMKVQIEGLVLRKDGERDYKQFDFTVSDEFLMSEFKRLEGKLIKMPVNVLGGDYGAVRLSLLPCSYPVEIKQESIKPVVQDVKAASTVTTNQQNINKAA